MSQITEPSPGKLSKRSELGVGGVNNGWMDTKHLLRTTKNANTARSGDTWVQRDGRGCVAAGWLVSAGRRALASLHLSTRFCCPLHSLQSRFRPDPLRQQVYDGETHRAFSIGRLISL